MLILSFQQFAKKKSLTRYNNQCRQNQYEQKHNEECDGVGALPQHHAIEYHRYVVNSMLGPLFIYFSKVKEKGKNKRVTG